MPGSTTLSIFSMAVLMPALWPIFERQARHQTYPPDKLYTAVDNHAYFDARYQTDPGDKLYTVPDHLAHFRDGYGFQQAEHFAVFDTVERHAKNPVISRHAATSRTQMKSMRQVQEAVTDDGTSSVDELVGETEKHHALPSEISSDATYISMWHGIALTVSAVGAVAAEALLGLMLLWKCLKRRRACSVQETPPCSTDTAEDEHPSFSAATVEDEQRFAKNHGRKMPEQRRTSLCTSQGGQASQSSVAPDESMHAAMRCLSAGSEMLSGTVHASAATVKDEQRSPPACTSEGGEVSVPSIEADSDNLHAARQRPTADSEALRGAVHTPAANAKAEQRGPPPSTSEAAEVSLSSVDAESDTLRAAMKRLTADNEALRGTVHAIWRGERRDIWDLEGEGASDHSSIPSARAHGKMLSTRSISSVVTTGPSSSQSSPCPPHVAPEAFSIFSRESSFAKRRKNSKDDTTSSDKDSASSHHLTSSDDDAESSYHPASSDEDDAASSHRPVSSCGDGDTAVSSCDDDDHIDSDVQALQSICFSKPVCSASMGDAAPCFSVQTTSSSEPEEMNRIAGPGGPRFSAPHAPSTTSSDESDGMSRMAGGPRFSAPYTPSTTSSDESEELSRTGTAVDWTQSQTPIRVRGSFHQKRGFSSPYATSFSGSSVSGSSELCDDEQQHSSEDENPFEEEYRTVKQALMDPRSPSRFPTIQESSDAKDDENEEEFVRNSWKLVDGKLTQRRCPTQLTSGKPKHENWDLKNMMLSLW